MLYFSRGDRGAARTNSETMQKPSNFPRLRRKFGGWFLESTNYLHFELPVSLGEHHKLHSDADDLSRNETHACAVSIPSC